MFSELLGVPNLVPMAALSSEIYLPHDPDAPLTDAIAEYIRRRIAVDEQGDALLAMLTQVPSWSRVRYRRCSQRWRYWPARSRLTHRRDR